MDHGGHPMTGPQNRITLANGGMPPQRRSTRSATLKRGLYVTTLDGAEHLAAIADDTDADRRQLDRDAMMLMAREDIASARVSEPAVIIASSVKKGTAR